MSTSQRVSRGFHRLELFLAAIALIVGAAATLAYALQQANYDLARHEVLMCAHEQIASDLRSKLIPDRNGIDLTQIGCPDPRFDLGTSGHITYGEARNPPEVTWDSSFRKVLAVGLAVTLVVSLAIYGLAYAIAPTRRFLYWVLVLGVGFLLAVFGAGAHTGWLSGLVLATVVGLCFKFLIDWFRQPRDDNASISAANNKHEGMGPDPKQR